jgi:hypothetical protein
MDLVKLLQINTKWEIPRNNHYDTKYSTGNN